MYSKLGESHLFKIGLLAIVIVGLVFFDVIFLNRTLQPSNIVPHMGRPVDWQASSAVLPVINPDARASDGFADLNASAWQFEPARYWMARNFAEGQSPWWNPYSASGTLGPEVLVDIKFSPHTVISAWLFDASPESFDYGLIVVYCVGAFFVLMVLRQIFTLEWLPAMAGAVVYLLNGFAIPNLNTHIGQPYFYSPVLLFSVLLFAQRQTISRWVFLVLSQAVLLTINIMTTMMLVLIVVHLIGFIYWLSVARDYEKLFPAVFVRYFYWVASGFLFSLLLVGPLWFPIINSFFVTDMVRDFDGRSLQPAREVESFLSVFTPKHFWQELANPPRYVIYPDANLEKSNGLIAYVGLVASFIAGFCFSSRRSLSNAIPVLCMLLVFFCYLRIFDGMDFINYIPVLRSIGNQYWGCLSSVAFFVLIAFSFQNIYNRDFFAFPALIVLIIQWVSFFVLIEKIGNNVSGIYALYLMIISVIFVFCVAVFLCIKFDKFNSIKISWVLFFAMVFELLFYMNTVRPMRFDPVASAPEFVRFIRGNIHDARVLGIGQDKSLYPEYGAMFGIKQADTQNPGLFPWYEDFYDRYFGNDTFLFLALDGSFEKKRKKNALKDHILDEKALDVASVKYLVVSDAAVNYISFLQERNYPMVFKGDGVSVFENVDYVPSVSLASAALDVGLDAARLGGDARIVSYRNTEVVIEAESAHPATLVLSDTWSPSWKAVLDGDPVAVRRVNEAFRGVAFPAGRHRVVFYYDLPSLRYGYYASIFAAFGMIGVCGWSWSRRRMKNE